MEFVTDDYELLVRAKAKLQELTPGERVTWSSMMLGLAKKELD